MGLLGVHHFSISAEVALCDSSRRRPELVVSWNERLVEG